MCILLVRSVCDFEHGTFVAHMGPKTPLPGCCDCQSRDAWHAFNRRLLGVILVKKIILLLAMMIPLMPLRATSEPFPLEAYQFNDLDGAEHSLAEWKGQVVALNFWATWCSPCLQEMPELVSLQETFGARGLQFVGLAVETGAEQVRAVADKLGVNYPVLMDEDGALELAAVLGNQDAAMPFTVIFDRQGEVVFTRKGTVKFEEVEAVIAPLLEQN